MRKESWVGQHHGKREKWHRLLHSVLAMINEERTSSDHRAHVMTNHPTQGR